MILKRRCGKKLAKIHRGDKNVLRAKSKSLRGNFMVEGENISQYVGRIKEVVNATRGADGKISDEVVINKVLRTLLPI